MGRSMTEIYEFKDAGKSFAALNGPVFSSKTEQRMLLMAKAPYFLTPRLSFDQQGESLSYDISCLISITDLGEDISIGSELITALFLRVCDAAFELGKFMLSEDNICLVPENIYLDREEQDIRLLLIPAAKERDFKNGIKRLLEFLLVKADTADEEGLRLLCRLYQSTEDRAFCVEHFYNVLKKNLADKYKAMRALDGEGPENMSKGLIREDGIPTEDLADIEIPWKKGGKRPFRPDRESDRLLWEDGERGYEPKARDLDKAELFEEESPYGLSLEDTETGTEKDKTGGLKTKLMMAMAIMTISGGLVILLRGLSAFVRMLPVFLILCVTIIVFLFISSLEMKRTET